MEMVTNEAAVSAQIAAVSPQDDEESDGDDTNVDAEPNHTPEYLQRKLYFLLEHLKEMHSELPE